MAKQEAVNIIKTEVINLNFYAVRSKDGKWLRSKGQSGYGKSWVDNLSDAKIYGKPGPAKAQVTFWASHYPNFGVPDLVLISTGECNYIDQVDRVSGAIIKKTANELRYKIRSLTQLIDRNELNKYRDLNNIAKWKTELENCKEELKKAQKKS